MLNRLILKLLNILEINYDKDAHNIERELQRRALSQAADFVEENMAQIKSFTDKYSLLKYSLDLAKNDGLFMEFGVYQGDTINFIASNTDQIVYGFDSFEGLPEDWRSQFVKGTFKVDKLPNVKKNVKLIKGWFENSLPQFIEENPNKCAFIHIDCDLYSSTNTIFNLLSNKITKNTIIVFDEFFNYPGWKEGEYKSFIEFIDNNNIKFEYLGYCRYDEQVAVKILDIKNV
jgi:hypothetical protein